MVDVGQGDCMILHSRNQTMLLDTGGLSQDSKNKVYQDKLKPLLLSLGIRSLDILALSHGDYDHLGEALSILNDFKVKNVFFNDGAFNQYEKEIISLLEERNIPYLRIKKDDTFQLGNFFFYSLNQSWKEENPSSMVLLGKVRWNYFLLTGDMTSDTEKVILENFDLPELLFLKVPHHGSKTSSSLTFLEAVKPTYALISVGKSNRYHHPNLETVTNLTRCSRKVYMTSVHGSILINFRKDVTFSFFPP